MTLIFIAQLFLGAVFIVSAVTKVLNPLLFIFNVENYKLLPGPLAQAYGWALPWAEMGTGLALALGLLTPWAGAAALAMLTSFLIAMVVAILQKRHVECTCFGLLYREKVGWNTVARDLVLAGLAVLVVLLPGRSPLAEALRGRASLEGAALLGLALLVIAGSVTLGYRSRTVIRRGT
jgi:uncharacterized membrane protein YphA (DoxX/SURF4 family)